MKKRELKVENTFGMKYGRHKVLAIVLALMAERVSATGQSLGCYDALPDGFSSKGVYSYQSSLSCSETCSGSDYFALYNGDTCYCGSTAPSSSADGTCDLSCAGYPSEMCGGSSAYDIYAQEGVDISNISSADTSSSASSSSTSSSSSTAESSTSASSTTTSESSTTTSSSTVSSTQTTTSNDTTNDTSSSTTSPTTTTEHTTSSTTDGQLTTSRLTTIIENSSSVATSIIYVTQSISAPSSATASSTATPSDSSKNSSAGSSKGAIIGGVVGGVLGAVVIIVALVFLFRRRLFGDGYEDAESMMADDEAYEAALKTNPFTSSEDKEADVMMLGRRRLSEGSLADAADYQMKVLRVANPDDD